MSRRRHGLQTWRNLRRAIQSSLTKVFNRIGRNIELRQAGRAFLQKARAVFATARSAELALLEFSDLKRGVLPVQASQTIASYWLPRHSVALRRAYPLIDMHLNIGNTAQVVAAIESGSAELGFVEGAFHSEQLARSPVARDQLIVVVAPERNSPPDSGRSLKSRLGTARARIRFRPAFEDALVQLGLKAHARTVGAAFERSGERRSATVRSMSVNS
jgi:DNA-binding transcriptional LysR family regulator